MRISDWSSDVCSSDLLQVHCRAGCQRRVEPVDAIAGDGIGFDQRVGGEVALMALAIGADQGGGLGVGQILDALLAAEVELDPEPLVGCIDEAESVAAKAMHEAIALGEDRKSTRLNSSH